MRLSDQLKLKLPARVAPDLPVSISYGHGNTIALSGEGIDSRNLLQQVLLHLQRFSSTDLSQTSLIDNEIERQAEKLARLRSSMPKTFNRSGLTDIKLQCSWLDLIDPSIAEVIHRTHHYLGTFRGDAVHLGLYYDEAGSRKPRLMSIASLSPFDLTHIADALPTGLRQEQVLVLSRLFAFDWCPRNTISYTLGRVFSWLRTRLPHIKMLITYLNPNLGFTGTVYKATNWTLFGYEKKRRYLYLDSNYVTDRHMIQVYGTADLQRLRNVLGDRVSESVLSLQPLELYAFFLDDVLRRKNRCGFNYEFKPSSALVGR